MQQLELTLPGGLAHRGAVLRRVRLRPITGRLELALAELGGDRVECVDQALALVIERLGELESSPDLPGRMCVGDRDYVTLELARILRGTQHWLSSKCGSCGELLDVGVDLSAVPASAAGPGYPTRALAYEGHEIVVRVPVGADLAALRSHASEHEAARSLLTRCILTIDGREVDAESLGEVAQELLDGIDAALDDLTPMLADRVETACPSCGAAQELPLDPLALLIGKGCEALFEDVHALASSYHWSARDILDLPREHRHFYLRLVARDQGMVSQRDS